jgi:hypothetical protein
LALASALESELGSALLLVLGLMELGKELE